MQKPKYNLIILFLLLFVGLTIPIINFFTRDNLEECGYSSNTTIKNIDLKLNLINENGDEILLADLVEKYNLIYFGYSFCPDVCPIDLGRNTDVINLLDEKKYQILPIFITVDPSRDSATRLKEYTDLIHDKLIGLTGSDKQIEKVKRNFMVYGSKNGSGDNYLVDHSTFTYLISNTGELLWHFKRQDKPEEIKNRIECIIENED